MPWKNTKKSRRANRTWNGQMQLHTSVSRPPNNRPFVATKLSRWQRRRSVSLCRVLKRQSGDASPTSLSRQPINWILLAAGLALLCGCDRLPGKPKFEDRWRPPQDNKNFADLFDGNCRACHSNGQTLGASISMNNPPYLAIVPEEVMHREIQQGIRGTAMPGFSTAAGGMLTDEQINILVDGIHQWGKGHETPADNLPPYSAPLGDVERGKAVFAQDCAGCHGPEGDGVKGKAGSVVNATYLNLVSDQYLRTVVIAGRPDLGMPGFRDYVRGKPMTPDEISDVVAWLSSHRQGPAPGQTVQATQASNGTQSSTSNQ
jgi:cytochrome c oxidase cbb3-type subunit III